MNANGNWARRNVRALQVAGAILSTLVLVIVVSRHGPEEAARGLVAAATAEATPAAESYYFPSQYVLNAPSEDREAAPTF